MVAKNPYLGRGIYTLAEVGRLVGMSPATARSWYLESSRGGDPVLHSAYQRVDGDLAVSFLDLMEAHAVRELRGARVTMREIRAAQSRLGEHLKTSHPFAHTDLYTDGRTVLADFSQHEGSESLRGVINGQGFFYAMRDLLKRVEPDPDTGLAARWNVAEGVLIDPEVARGKPALRGTGTHTLVVARQYEANQGRADLVADLYDLSEDQVLHAVEFEASLNEPHHA